MTASLRVDRLESPLVPAPVEYRVLVPGDRAPDESLPLILLLHGANSSSALLESIAPMVEELWAADELPRAVVACASTPTAGGFYIDGEARWETFVAEAFPVHLVEAYGADPSRVGITGSSMGGYGALKMAFRHPERYLAVAAIAPTVFPGEAASDVRPRNRLWVLQSLFETMTAAGYVENHVVARLRANAAAVRASGLAVYLECGDDDAFRLQDAAEALHRVLWDEEVPHDYRLLRNVDHLGPATKDRQRAALIALGGSLRPPEADATPPEIARWITTGKGKPPPVDFNAAYGPRALRRMISPLVDAATAEDPTTTRRYGVLPPTETTE